MGLTVKFKQKFYGNCIGILMVGIKVCFKTLVTWIIKLHNFSNICSGDMIQNVPKSVCEIKQS